MSLFDTLRQPFSFNGILAGGAALLLLSNVILLRTNSQISTAAKEYQRIVELAPGARMGPLRGKSIPGDDLTISYGVDRRYTLLFVFSASCPTCEDNWPQWDKLRAAVQTPALRIVCVDMSALTKDDYIAKHRLVSIPVMQHIDPRGLYDYRLRLTPTTILLDPLGVVVAAKTGLLDDSDLTAMESLIRGGTK